MKKIINYLVDYKWVLIFAAVVAIGAGFFAWQGDKYDASVSLTINRLGTQNADDYKYDSYYALKASDEFGSAVVGWFKTPETTKAVYQRAQVVLGPVNLDSLSRRFSAAKISPATVEVRFSAATENQAKALGRAIVEELAVRVDLLKSASNQGVSFAVVGSEPVIIDNSSDIVRNLWAGFLSGLVFAFFVKSAKDYFKE